jgi:hypothetical protein
MAQCKHWPGVPGNEQSDSCNGCLRDERDALRARLATAERHRRELADMVRRCVGVEGTEDGDDAGLYDLALAAMDQDNPIELFADKAQDTIADARALLARIAAEVGR